MKFPLHFFPREGNFENFFHRQKLKPGVFFQALFSNIAILQKRYSPVIQHDPYAVQEWEEFREELKHRNRFFPKNTQATDQLKELFDFFVAAPANIPTKVFRARICEQLPAFSLCEMGKPPAALTSNGRANPVGIPCLYVASDPATAIAEIRPHKGELICVAEFKVGETIKLVDLRSPRKTVSLFDLFDEQIKLLRRYMAYVCRLSEELTLPVLPKSIHLEYLPSQYLCEFIKHCKYDGVIYKSAMGTGVNYAIFNDTNVTGVDVKHYKIDDILVKLLRLTLVDPASLS